LRSTDSATALRVLRGPVPNFTSPDKVQGPIDAMQSRLLIPQATGSHRSPVRRRDRHAQRLGHLSHLGLELMHDLLDRLGMMGVLSFRPGERRLLQGADGHVANIVSGTITAENGPTEAHPGRLVRGRQPAPD
jgi:hypothetical protein